MRTYPTVPLIYFYDQLRQNYYLKLTNRRVVESYSTTMRNNVIISTARAEGSRVDCLPVEPLIMLPRPIVVPYINYTDPLVMDKCKGMGSVMEPEGCPRVGEYIHLRWTVDKNCYPCRVVCHNTRNDYTTVIYGNREHFAIELVTTRNKDWHWIVDAHKSKRGEDLYNPTAYEGRILFFNDVSLGLSADPTTPTAYVCEYLQPTNDICLHRNRFCKQNTTTWLYKVIFYRTSGCEENEVVDLVKRDFIIIG